jgi:hypothetical protein
MEINRNLLIMVNILSISKIAINSIKTEMLE